MHRPAYAQRREYAGRSQFSATRPRIDRYGEYGDSGISVGLLIFLGEEEQRAYERFIAHFECRRRAVVYDNYGHRVADYRHDFGELSAMEREDNAAERYRLIVAHERFCGRTRER